jgi:hypothetical protein
MVIELLQKEGGNVWMTMGWKTEILNELLSIK